MENRKELNVPFMSLEKVYDTQCTEELWRVSYEYGIEECLLRNVKSQYIMEVFCTCEVTKGSE